MKFKIYRDCDAKKLRKVVIELYSEDGELIDRRRMFYLNLIGCFRARLERKMGKMIEFAEDIAP